MAVSETRKLAFLRHLAVSGRIHQSAEKADISAEAIRVWRKEDDEFAERFVAAEELYCEKIEAEIERRAIDGWDEPIYQGGTQVGVKRRYSDTLLLAHAKSRMSKYRDKVEAEVTIKGSVLAVPAVALNEEAFNELVRSQGGSDHQGEKE